MHDLRLLTVLREVALRGSFSAAAEALAYTRPRSPSRSPGSRSRSASS